MSENHRCSVEDERIRMRHREALRAGMSNAEASAYANDPNSYPACAQSKLTAAASTVGGRGIVQLNSSRGSKWLAPPAPLSPKPGFWALPDNPVCQEKMDADRLVLQPDRVVFQARLAENLSAFSEFAFGVVRPGIPFKPNWHLEAMAEKLSQVASGNILRLIVTVPPRNLKSLLTSVALPAWFLGHSAWERVVVVSYSDFLARQHANDFRLLVRDPMYQATFPAMRLDRDTDREITTTKRGKRIATSIDGTLTGIGGHLILIDDPIKPGDAMSESVRARVIEGYPSTLL